LQSFETELLTQEVNLAGVGAINRELIAKAGRSPLLRDFRVAFVTAFPWLWLLLCVLACGEFVGYVTGRPTTAPKSRVESGEQAPVL
jgi:hypothetical protein